MTDVVAICVNSLVPLPRLRHIAAVVMACLISFANTQPVASDPAKTNIQIDYLGMTSNLMSGLFGTSPAMLGKYLDAREQTAVGEAIWQGKPKEAIKLALQFTSDKAIGNIPVLGQLYAMGQLGKQLGDQAWMKFGPGEFDKIYDKYFNDFSASELAQPPDDFVKAMIAQGSATVLFAWIDRQTGKNNSSDEKIQIVWNMIREKRNLEILCNERDLKRDNCNTGQLIKLEMNEATAIAQAALAVEQDRQKQRRAWLKEKARKLKAWKEKQKKDRAEFEAFLCDVWLGRIIDDKDQALPRPSDQSVEDLCGEKPKHPDDHANADSGNADTDQTAADQPVETPASGQNGPVAWSISASGDGDETVFIIQITNISKKPLPAVSVKIEAVGSFLSGGIAKGSGRSASLGAGQTRIHKVVTFGDVKGIVGTISSHGKTLAAFTRLTTKKNKITAEGPVSTYEGVLVGENGHFPENGKANSKVVYYRGGGKTKVVFLKIRGSTVTGAVWNLKYMKQIRHDEIFGELFPMMLDYYPLIKGTYNSRTGAIEARFFVKNRNSEIWRKAYDGELDIPIYGEITGKINNGLLSGTWTGWNEGTAKDGGTWKIVGLGKWSAKPCTGKQCETIEYGIKLR